MTLISYLTGKIFCFNRKFLVQGSYVLYITASKVTKANATALTRGSIIGEGAKALCVSFQERPITYISSIYPFTSRYYGLSIAKTSPRECFLSFFVFYSYPQCMQGHLSSRTERLSPHASVFEAYLMCAFFVITWNESTCITSWISHVITPTYSILSFSFILSPNTIHFQ